MSWEHGLFALSPDGRFLVWPVADEAIKFKDLNDPNSIYTGSRLRMMDLDSGQLVERFGGFEGNAHDIYFTEGGKTLVTAERFRSDARVRIWSFATGKLTREFAAIWKPEARVLRSRLSPDGKMLAVQYQGRSRGLHVESEVKTWDTATGNEIAGPPPSWFDADVMAFSPDGTTFAAAIGGGRTIQFQEVATGQVLGELKGPPDRVTALAFDPDRLCTGSPLATIIMWDRPRAALPPTDRE
jgi:WD40 repeat protein